MLTNILALIAVLLLIIVALGLCELVLRGFDRLLKRKWARRRHRRVLEQIGQQPLSIFHQRQAE